MNLYDFDLSDLDDVFGAKLVSKKVRRNYPQREIIWVPEQPGFGIRAHPTGRKVYFVRCQTSTGRRDITIGNADVLDRKTALDIARRCVYHSEGAGNPADERKRIRRTPLFQDYLDDYWKVMFPTWKPSTQRTENKYRRLYLVGAFSDMGVDEITHAAISKWMIASNLKGSPGAVNRAFDRLKAVMAKAEEWGYRPEGSNPCRDVSRNSRRKMERFLNEQEFARIGAVLQSTSGADRSYALALTLLLLTGCRKEEIAGLTWSEVGGGRIYLDDSKTGARVVHLSSHAQALLKGLRRGKPQERVFKGRGGTAFRIERYWDRVRKAARLESVRLHDIRHSYASHAARMSLPMPTVQRLLGHAKIESTARYTHYDDRHLAEVAQRISDLIECSIGEGM